MCPGGAPGRRRTGGWRWGRPAARSSIGRPGRAPDNARLADLDQEGEDRGKLASAERVVRGGLFGNGHQRAPNGGKSERPGRLRAPERRPAGRSTPPFGMGSHREQRTPFLRRSRRQKASGAVSGTGGWRKAGCADPLGLDADELCGVWRTGRAAEDRSGRSRIGDRTGVWRAPADLGKRPVRGFDAWGIDPAAVLAELTDGPAEQVYDRVGARRHPVKESSASRAGDLAGIRAGREIEVRRTGGSRWRNDRRKLEMSDKLLIDTSVWLDLAKDYRLSAVLTAIEDLIDARTIELIMPQIVLDEFARNRDRVVEQSRRSFSSHIKRVQEAVTEFGEEDRRAPRSGSSARSSTRSQ